MAYSCICNGGAVYSILTSKNIKDKIMERKVGISKRKHQRIGGKNNNGVLKWKTNQLKTFFYIHFILLESGGGGRAVIMAFNTVYLCKKLRIYGRKIEFFGKYLKFIYISKKFLLPLRKWKLWMLSWLLKPSELISTVVKYKKIKQKFLLKI